MTTMMIGGTLAFPVLSVWVKASLHVAVLTAVVVGLLVLFGAPYTVGLPLIPVVAWARRVLKHHTLAELAVGVLVSSAMVALLAKI
jgi:membrane-associated phospholipid phosphatase